MRETPHLTGGRAPPSVVAVAAMSRPPFSLALCCVLFLLVWPVLAKAGDADADLPPLAQPGQWNYVTQDDAASSSHCIGDPRTPLCAVETLLACFQRGRAELCRMVDDGAEQYSQVFASPVEPGKYLAYRVMAAQRVREGEDVPAPAQPGDVLLTIDQREGTLGRYARADGSPASDFLLRRQSDGLWKVAAWGAQGEMQQ